MTRPARGHGVATVVARAATAAVLLTVAADARAAENTCPPWLRQAAAAALTPAQASAPAVVLLDERMVTVSDDGTSRTHHLYAARVGSREGRDAASLGEVYLTDTGRVREARGWIIQPSGEVQEVEKKNVPDLALALNDVYNEARLRLVQAVNAEPGTVFGAEIVSEDRSVFAQLEWPMQREWPVRIVRRGLTVPSGWRVSAETFNSAPIEPSVTGSSYTWQLADLARLDDEPARPPGTSLVARLAVSYFPGPGAPALASFADWTAVSRWLAALAEPQAAADPALTAKARELTAGATSELERIRAIGAYVQRVQYISIQIGVGRGGGYRPRPAAQVFARNLGDCKDKANLMRAMLAAVGIRSFLVSAFLGDREYVRERWPSPQQFNHCILAVALAGTPPDGLAVVDSPAHGRLLIVDPTAEYTPIGTLPGDEEGSLALVVAPDGGPLLRLPDSPPGSHRVERVVDAVLQPDGAIAAKVRENRRGDPAGEERGATAGLAPADYQRRLERAVAREVRAARVSDVAHRDSDGAFETSMRVAAGGYAQLIQSRLLVMKPPFATTDGLPSLSGASRRYPVVLDAVTSAGTLRVEAPAGFDVDELPQAGTIDSAFGRYSLSARQDGATVVVERQLSLRRATLPPADYPALRAFLDKVRAADTSPVVFRRR
jgi:hypothetical protein